MYIYGELLELFNIRCCGRKKLILIALISSVLGSKRKSERALESYDTDEKVFASKLYYTHTHAYYIVQR